MLHSSTVFHRRILTFQQLLDLVENKTHSKREIKVYALCCLFYYNSPLCTFKNKNNTLRHEILSILSYILSTCFMIVKSIQHEKLNPEGQLIHLPSSQLNSSPAFTYTKYDIYIQFKILGSVSSVFEGN